jgi:hypothetical protein
MERVRGYTKVGVRKAIMIGLIAVMATVFGVSPLLAQTKQFGSFREQQEMSQQLKDSGREEKIGSPWYGDTKTWKDVTGSGFLEARKSLKQLQAKVEVGISYKDYTVALGDVKFAVDNFLASPDAKDKPALSNAIRNSLKCYIDVKTLWGLKIEGTELNRAFRGLGIKSDSDDFLRTGGRHVDDIWKVLVKNHPEFAALSTAGEPQLDYHGDSYYTVKIDNLIRLLWVKASALTPVVER